MSAFATPSLHKNKPAVSEIILGGQDGLVNILGLVLGLAAASNDTRIVLAGGLAAAFAESISMTAVAFTSKKAEHDLYQADLKMEREEVIRTPGLGREEIRQIYIKKGFSGKLLDEVVDQIVANKKTWVSTVMAEDLHLTPIKIKDVLKATAIIGVATITGSIIPLLPFFFLPVKISIVASLIFSMIALILIGYYKARKTLVRPLRSEAEMVIIGIGAAIVGYLIGLIFQTKSI